MDVPELELTATLRVHFAGLSLGVGCSTGTFQVKVDSGDYGNMVCPTGGYDFLTGEFCLQSPANVTIPALLGTACMNHGGDINSDFGLGSSGAALQLINGTALDSTNGDPLDN